MTDSNGHIEPYWFTRTAGEIRAAVEGRAETWASVPGYSRYEWSDKGRWRRVAYTDGQGRRLGLKILSTTPGGNGYVNVNVTNDQGEKTRPTLHAMVLLAHHPAFRGLDRFPDGLETRHGPAGPLFNAYPENLWPGTKKENAADKYGDEGPPVLFPCKNAPRCPQLVAREDRRCADCVAEVGRQSAALLAAGMNLDDVARLFGYTRGDWTYRLAVKYGGYAGTREQARTQRPPMGQRALLRLRRRALLRQASGGSDAL